MIDSHWNQWHPIYWLSQSSDSCWQRVEKSVNDICMETVKQVKQVYTYLRSIVNARKFQSSNDKLIMHRCKNILFFGCLYLWLWLSRPGLLRSWYCSTLRYFHDQTVNGCCMLLWCWKLKRAWFVFLHWAWIISVQSFSLKMTMILLQDDLIHSLKDVLSNTNGLSFETEVSAFLVRH